MSICSLRGFSVRHLRQVLILAHARAGVGLLPACNELRLSLSFERYNHNSLYQMVKKRTLEARSKLQHNKFPNHQACISKTPKSRTTYPTCPPQPSSAPPPPSSSSPPSHPPPSKIKCPPPPDPEEICANYDPIDESTLSSARNPCRNPEVESVLNRGTKSFMPTTRPKQPVGCDSNITMNRPEKVPTPPGRPQISSAAVPRKLSGNEKAFKARAAVQPCKPVVRPEPIACPEQPPKSMSAHKLSSSPNLICRPKPVSQPRPTIQPKPVCSQRPVCQSNESKPAYQEMMVCSQQEPEGVKKRATIQPCVAQQHSASEPCQPARSRTEITPCKPSRSRGGGDVGGGSGSSGSGGSGGGDDCDGLPPPPPPCKSEIQPSKQSLKSDSGVDCGDGPDGLDPKMKMLLALLAALGLGGLIWLLMRKKKSDDECDLVSPQPGTGQVPVSSADLPKHVPYLLVGGGTAAFSAFRAIKSNDPRAKVLMITNENRKPYMRPPLSKELWYSAQKGDVTRDYRFKQWTGAERSLYFEPEEFFVDPTKLMESVNGGIAVAQGFTVRKVNAEKRTVTLTDGYEISYDECLIATGCSPKNLPVFTQAPPSVREKVMVYRSPDDFERLKRYADEKKCITIVGSGFTGSELACSLASYAQDKTVKIYQIFPEAGNMSRVLPDYLSKWTMCKVEAAGVCVLPLTSIKNAQRDEDMLKLTLSNGKGLLTDVVVVCVGCEPNTSIAATSDLEVDSRLGGFVVNSELEARRNLFVAGDASCFYDPLLGRRRVEHHDHSVVSGRLAGENMVGKKKAYTHQSMFWSDLGPEIGYEGIGLVDASLPTVGVFALPSLNESRRTDNLIEQQSDKSGDTNLTVKTDLPDINCDPVEDEYGRGVIFYMKDDKIVGILLWNLFNRIGLARTIINQNKKFDDLNEVAKLFEIHA